MASLKALCFPAGTHLLRLLPRAVVLKLAHVVADLSMFYAVACHRGVERNLRHSVPGLAATERQRLKRATFRQFARIWIDFLRAPLLTRNDLDRLFVWRTRRQLDAALAAGRGVILVTGHVGPLDLVGLYLAAQGYPISVVVEDLEPALHHVWSRYRGLTGLRVLSRRRGAVAVSKALRRGEIVALVCDRVIEGAGREVNFCGGRRRIPTGPAAFAIRTGATVALLEASCRPDDARYELRISPPLVLGTTVEEATDAIAAELSGLIRRRPDQWFVFDAEWLESSSERVTPLCGVSGL